MTRCARERTRPLLFGFRGRSELSLGQLGMIDTSSEDLLDERRVVAARLVRFGDEVGELVEKDRSSHTKLAMETRHSGDLAKLSAKQSRTQNSRGRVSRSPSNEGEPECSDLATSPSRPGTNVSELQEIAGHLKGEPIDEPREAEAAIDLVFGDAKDRLGAEHESSCRSLNISSRLDNQATAEIVGTHQVEHQTDQRQVADV